MAEQVRRCGRCGVQIPARTGRAAHLCQVCRREAELDTLADELEQRRQAVITVQALARQAAHRGVSGGIAYHRLPWMHPRTAPMGRGRPPGAPRLTR